MFKVLAIPLLLFSLLFAQVDSISVDSGGYNFSAYMPTSGPRPLPTVFLIHGGGFTQGSRHEYGLELDSLARSGFLAVSIDYPLGWDQVNPCDPQNGNGAAMYKAMQSLRRIMNYPGLPMDPQRVFLFGESAGAATSAAYNLKGEDWAALVDTSFLGPLDTAPKVLGICVEQGVIVQAYLHSVQYHGLLLVSLEDHNQWFEPVPCGMNLSGGEAISKQLYATGYCVRKVYRCDGVHDGWTHEEQTGEMISFFNSILLGSCSNSCEAK